MQEPTLPELPEFARALIEADAGAPGPSPRLRRTLWRRIAQSALATGLGAGVLATKVGMAAVTKTVIVGGIVAAAATVVVSVRDLRAPAAEPSGPPAAQVSPSRGAIVSRAPSVDADPPAHTLPEDPRPRPVAAPAAARQRPPIPVERTLIDEARAALGRGDLERLARRLAEHRRHHPGGVFSEEREALEIAWLVRSGRNAEAQAAAATFRARHPASVLAPWLEGLLRGLR